jgi:hypothetical protein
MAQRRTQNVDLSNLDNIEVPEELLTGLEDEDEDDFSERERKRNKAKRGSKSVQPEVKEVPPKKAKQKRPKRRTDFEDDGGDY